MYQHDPRHVDVLVKDLGLEQGNSVQTPTTRDVTAEEPEPSDQVQHSRYRSQVARCLFFIQHRADVTFIVNELCQRMSNPAQQSLAKLKMLVRYVKRERQLGARIQSSENGRRSDDIFRFRLGRRDTARQSHFESIHTQATDHCKKQRRSTAVCCNYGSVCVKKELCCC